MFPPSDAKNFFSKLFCRKTYANFCAALRRVDAPVPPRRFNLPLRIKKPRRRKVSRAAGVCWAEYGTADVIDSIHPIHGGVGMGDDFMDYMLYLDDDDEDNPKSGGKSGCGCLPSILIGCMILVIIRLLGH